MLCRACPSTPILTVPRLTNNLLPGFVSTVSVGAAIGGTASLTNSTCVTNVKFGDPSIAIGGLTSLVDSTNSVYVFALAEMPGTNVLYIIDQPGCTDIGMGTVSRK